MTIAYLGPEGTFSHEALLAQPTAAGARLDPLPTIYDAVMAVHHAAAERALVPIENSLEGSVAVTLDALAFETEDVVIVGEVVHPVRQCLVAREPVPLDAIGTVVSHPQASGQCARFIRTRLPRARVVSADSTADAVRRVAAHDAAADADGGAWAALGTRVAADLYGCQVLRSGVEDVADNETRFIWIARKGAPTGDVGPWKTSLVFWGLGAEASGWLVRCLSEFAFRGVNLTRIESRPRKQGLGRYIFFVDCEGCVDDPAVAGAIVGLRAQAHTVRVLGSYPAAV